MAIDYRLDPLHGPRKITSVGDATSQFQPFSQMYREVWDFIDDGGLDALGLDGPSVALWRKNVRDGVVNYYGKPSEIDFFRQMMGGTPKEMDATSITVQYNGPTDYNIYSGNSVVSSTSTVTGATFGTIVNGSITCENATFVIAAETYADNGKKSNINLGDSIYNYVDGTTMIVIKKDTSVDYAHQITVTPNDPATPINIVAMQPMQPIHAMLDTGYTDSSNSFPHTEWITLGYFKEYNPWSLRTDWETPQDLTAPYRDVLQFPIIFDMVTGAEISTWDLQAAQHARERLVMGENVMFFTGQSIKNTSLLAAGYTNKYFGFDGLMNMIWFGGGNIQEYDNSYGYDFDVDFMQMTFQNDAMKLSDEMLFMAGLKWIWSTERRSQDMFKNNSGACTFQTFDRMGADDGDLRRYQIDSYRWRNYSMHIKKVGAWTDKRWIGNAYFPNMALILPGQGMPDSNGRPTPPVEFWIPKNTRVSSQWTEVLRDHMQLNDKASKWSGTITHKICMSVNGVENMWVSMPKYLS